MGVGGWGHHWTVAWHVQLSESPLTRMMQININSQKHCHHSRYEVYMCVLCTVQILKIFDRSLVAKLQNRFTKETID